MSDYDIRALGIEQIFALDPIPDNCVDAANRTARMYDLHFPGWELYCRIVRGDRVFDKRLALWAVRSARRYARATKINGRKVVRVTTGRMWIAQAAIDALEFVIFGVWAESPTQAANRHGVDNEMYGKFRGEIAAMMLVGFEGYSGALHGVYAQVAAESRRAA